MFLGVCGMSSNSSNLQMAGVSRIYRPPSLIAIAPTVSKKQHTIERTDASGGAASVHPVTLRPEVAVELLTHCLRHHRFNR